MFTIVYDDLEAEPLAGFEDGLESDVFEESLFSSPAAGRTPCRTRGKAHAALFRHAHP